MTRHEITDAGSRLFGWFLIAYGMVFFQQFQPVLDLSEFDVAVVLEFGLPLLPLFVLGILLARGNEWHGRWLGGTIDAESGARDINFSRGRLRTFAFGLIGALAAFRALRRALAMALPLPLSTIQVLYVPTGGGVHPIAGWQWWSLGLHVLLAVLLLVGPLRIHRLLRGMRPKPGPRDGSSIGARALVDTCMAAFAFWYGVCGLVLLSRAVFPDMARGTGSLVTSGGIAGAFLVVGAVCARMVARGSTWRGPDAVVGLELGAIFLLLELVPDAVREIMRRDDGSLGVYLSGSLGTDSLVMLLTASGLCLAALGWAQHRRTREPPENKHPEADVFV